MIHGHATNSAHKRKILEMLISTTQLAVRVNLERVGVEGRVLEESIVGIKHLTRDILKPFPEN